MEMSAWMNLGLGAAGFLSTWILGAFYLGRAVEQMRAAVKADVDTKIDEIEARFAAEQRAQDHNFGEVGLAIRQYVADVEKLVREVEIYGRDNYVKIPDFERAIDRLSGDFKAAVEEIKRDIRRLMAPGQEHKS
jgi:hypothetical protein